MKITMRSPRTGLLTTLDLDVTHEQLVEFASPSRIRLIQEIFPHLSLDHREFLKTGYTPEDWAAMFPEEDR